MMFLQRSLFYFFLLFSFALFSHAVIGQPQQSAQQTQFTSTGGCQYSINDGIISDGKGHSRPMTPQEEQQMASYHAQVARATQEFQQQMAQVVDAPFSGGFGIGDDIPNIGNPPELRLPQPPCFHVNSTGGSQHNKSAGVAPGVGDEDNFSAEE